MIKLYSKILFFSLIIVPFLSIYLGLYIDPIWFLKIEDLLFVFSIYILFMINITVINFNLEKTSSQYELKYTSYYNEKRLFRIVTFIFIFGLLGFVLNFYRVISSVSIIEIIGEGRQYELLFGKYTLINYLYFLNGLIVSMYIILKSIIIDNKKRKMLKFMFIISFISLLFHGVKGTIIFPLVILFFSYILIEKKVPKSIYLFFILIVFLVFFMNFYMRAGDEISSNAIELILKKIFLYLTPAYSNLFYEMSFDSTFTGGTYTFGIFTMLWDYISNGFVKSSTFDPLTSKLTGQGLNLVHPGYNTGTIFREAYFDFSYAGIFLYIFFISLYIVLIYKLYMRYNNIFFIYWLSVTSTCLLFIFWGNHFVRIQYIYWIFLSLFIHFLTKKGYVCEKKDLLPK